MNGVHPWMPVSPCGEGCLPPVGAVPTVGWVRRLLGVAAMLVTGAALAIALPRLSTASREWALRAWFRALLATLRIQLAVTGEDRFGPPGIGVLVVSNHMSWLDMIALGAVQPLRMVAKGEVRSWPLIGPLARRAGTFFVDRERLSALPRMVAAVSGALTGGAAIGAFPEGTHLVWAGQRTVPTRGFPGRRGYRNVGAARRVALPRGRCRRHHGRLVRRLRHPVGVAVLVTGVRGLVVEVGLLPLLPVDGRDRRVLAAGAQAAVTAAAPTLESLTPAPEPVSAALARRAA